MTKLSRGLSPSLRWRWRPSPLSPAARAGSGAAAEPVSCRNGTAPPIPSAVISLAAQTSSFDPTATVSATDRAQRP